MAIQIVGYTTSNKVPGFFAETVYGAGPITIGDIPLVLALVGTKTASGTATEDADIKDVYSLSDADTYFGAGSELDVMCAGALQIPGVYLKGIPVAEAGGSAAATATITITGTWTTAGTYSLRVDGVPFQVTFSSTDTISTAADAIVAAISANSRASVTAAKGAGPGYVVTLTRKSKGARGNQGVLAQDVSGLPSGCSVAIAGGTALTGGPVPFTGGSGADSVANVLTLMSSMQYDRIVFAPNDSTNAARIKTWINNQAGPLVGYTQHACIAMNSASLSAVTAIAQTAYNAERVQVLWLAEGETIPSFVASTFMAYRTAIEQEDPDASYDDYEIPGVAPQTARATWPTMSTLISALDNGVTPLATTPIGTVKVIRSITSHSLDSSGNPDYRTLDTSEAVVPDYVRRVLALHWVTFKKGNPRVGPDPDPTQKSAPSGVATPSLYRRSVTQILKGFEAGTMYPTSAGSFPNGSIITDVDGNPVVCEYNATAKRLMMICPVKPTPNSHAAGVSVRQMS